MQPVAAAPPSLPPHGDDDDGLFRPGSDSSSLAVMLYDAGALQFAGASGGNDARASQESHALLAGATAAVALPGREGTIGHGSVGASSVKVSALSVDKLADSGKSGVASGGAGGGGSSGKSKFSSPSPFHRFGMAMRRRKKRSLKLKHAAGSGNGALGGNSLYGSCASNLSGVSVGNGSAKGKGSSGGAGDASGGSSSSRTKLKFRWLRNMRSDPNLKETLAKSVQLRTTNPLGTGAGCIVGEVTKSTERSTGVVTIPKSPTVPSTKMPIPNVPGTASDAVGSLKEIAGCNLPTDYYSFLCDNQLSYESPGKSPGHLMRLEQALARRPSTIEEVLLQPAGPPTPPPQPPPPAPLLSSAPPAAITVSDTDCSVVKPRASKVKIGFNVSPVPPASPIEGTRHGSIESSFEIINKSDAPLDATEEHLSPAGGDSGTLPAAGSGHSFCNKLLQHIVTSVGGGSKAKDLPVPSETRKQDSDERFECPTATHSSSRSSSSCSSLAVAPSAAVVVQTTSGSPVLARSNRCAPFSFRELSAELRAAMKIPIPKHRSATAAATGPAAPSSSSSSSSSLNIAAGGGTTVRSIERTLSAPVAVQTLDTSGPECEIASIPSSAGNGKGTWFGGSFVGHINKTFKRFTSHVRGLPTISSNTSAADDGQQEGIAASTSFRRAGDRGEQRPPSKTMMSRFTSSMLNLTRFVSPTGGDTSETSSLAYMPSPSVASASSSASVQEDGVVGGERSDMSSLDHLRQALLSSAVVEPPGYGETGTDTDDSGLPTRPPSHVGHIDQFDVPFDGERHHRLVVEKSSSEKMLQMNVLDGAEYYQYAFRRGSSDDRMPSGAAGGGAAAGACAPDSGRGSTEQTSDASRDTNTKRSK
uniref:Uncharacterized protein n=1 Tax=Anopheles merus TaxID=30066 RepID=A0A182VNQ2_ANOME